MVGTTDVGELVETVVVPVIADEVLPGIVVEGAVVVACDTSCVAIEVSVVIVICVDTDGMMGAVVEIGAVT